MNTTQETLPEIQVATEALHARITITETEITQLKESVKTKKQLVRSLRKALSAFTPSTTTRKKKAAMAAAK